MANPYFTQLQAPQAIGTPSATDAQRRIAEALLKQGSSGAPVGHPLQALNRALQGFSGGMQLSQARQAEEAQRMSQMERQGANDDLKRRLIEAQIAKAQAGPDPTALQRNLSAAGIQPGTPEFRSAVLKGQDRSININNQFDQNTLSKELAKETAKSVTKVMSQGAKAGRDASALQIARQALDDPNFFSGTGGESIQGAKRALSTLFGVDVRGVQSGEVFGAIAKKIALQKKEDLPGPMSDSDREFLSDAGPSLTKTPEGNRILIELELAGKKHDLELARGVAELRASGKLNDATFAQLQFEKAQEYYNKAGPLFGAIQSSGQIPNRSPMAGIPKMTLPGGYTVEEVK